MTARKLVIGLTGGIGSGKSTVAALFGELGATLVDTDELAREVVEPGTPGLQAVVEAFGEEVLDASGALDRPKLRRRVFADAPGRERLERILHPRIRERMAAGIQSASGPYCVVSIPLLLETEQQHTVDRVLVVDVPCEMQIERALARDGSPRETIEGILAAQIDRQERLARADDVIDNSGSLAALRPQVETLHRRYLKLAQARR